MSFKSVSALTIMAVVYLCSSALAQPEDSDERKQVYRLLRDSSAVDSALELEDETVVWEPRIQKGGVEVSFALGFLGLKTPLLQHDQIIYKYTQEYTYFGDVEIVGNSAFNPLLRLGYNASTWLCVEAIGGMSFSDYTSNIVNRKAQKNEVGGAVEPDPPLGEFDAEARSLLTGQAGLNLVIYPFNFGNDGKGRWQPYLTAGGARWWYSMNSNYVDSGTGTWSYNGGLGVRLLADENISVRFEAIFNRHDLEWTPAAYFQERDEGSVLVPLEEWPVGGTRQTVTKYESNTMDLFQWSIGVQGSF